VTSSPWCIQLCTLCCSSLRAAPSLLSWVLLISSRHFQSDVSKWATTRYETISTIYLL